MCIDAGSGLYDEGDGVGKDEEQDEWFHPPLGKQRGKRLAKRIVGAKET